MSSSTVAASLAVPRPEPVTTAFRDFYAHYYPEVFHYCSVLVTDRELAHDLTQETFTRLYARWVSIRDPRAYLFHVATNLVRAAWRARANARAALAGLCGEATRPAPATDTAGELSVQLAVERLPARYREVVLLFYYADLPLAAVAAAVRRPEGTVKRQLSEARALLASDLEDSR